jgi:hypothetical protein
MGIGIYLREMHGVIAVKLANIRQIRSPHLKPIHAK